MCRTSPSRSLHQFRPEISQGRPGNKDRRNRRKHAERGKKSDDIYFTGTDIGANVNGGASGNDSITVTDDSDENPFNFAITGEVVPVPIIEVRVTGNGIEIADEDNSPDVPDGTDFGSVDQGDSPVVHDFGVTNDGNTTLTLGPVSVPTGFFVAVPPGSPVR